LVLHDVAAGPRVRFQKNGFGHYIGIILLVHSIPNGHSRDTRLQNGFVPKPATIYQQHSGFETDSNWVRTGSFRGTFDDAKGHSGSVPCFSFFSVSPLFKLFETYFLDHPRSCRILASFRSPSPYHPILPARFCLFKIAHFLIFILGGDGPTRRPSKGSRAQAYVTINNSIKSIFAACR
jgi:hypothetical protein